MMRVIETKQTPIVICVQHGIPRNFIAYFVMDVINNLFEGTR